MKTLLRNLPSFGYRARVRARLQRVLAQSSLTQAELMQRQARMNDALWAGHR